MFVIRGRLYAHPVEHVPFTMSLRMAALSHKEPVPTGACCDCDVLRNIIKGRPVNM
jgi:hypothetical protein